MNTLNHLATGAAIALVVNEPLLALPLAFLSHIGLDMLPHFGYPNAESGYGEALKHKLSYFSLAFDIIGIGILIALINDHGWLVYVAAVLALSPDLMWPYRYIWFERKGLVPPPWKVARFHTGIQFFEREWGIVIEIFYSVGMLIFIWGKV